ncbi:Anti-sigma-K factor RskA [Pseudoxanthomonas sp. GM95]|uniref:anti-sigma factor n=1 Tax=Pseudoxanthomonas sp. GM95 TaxID=1881043 RepID=UPI0008B9E775|nr:anti-sigma factor [Pseudoxanthomonas sp. GM95]SEL07258.1 Anti-sigma-K factor RskA [Pseudoxanthomonas sp. GM95]
MNTSTAPFESDPPERDVLAGEYVLGVLDAAGRDRVRSLMASDPVFADEVLRWEAHFGPLIDQVAPVAVPEYVWARIGNALGLAPAPRQAPVTSPAPKRGFWDNIGLWRSVGIGGFATAAVAVVALLSVLRTEPVAPTPPPVVAQQPPVPAMPQMVASLAGDDGKTGYVATMETRSGRMTIMPMSPTREDGRVPELWIIPKGGAPVSMGILDTEHVAEHTLPENLRALLNTDALLAITMEQPGGSPSGAPTGSIVAKGGITALLAP